MSLPPYADSAFKARRFPSRQSPLPQNHYLQMIGGIYAVLGIYLITAARKPGKNRSLISFTIWSSVVHAAIMGTQALYDSREYGHLVGDVPALLLVAAVLWLLSPKGERFIGATA